MLCPFCHHSETKVLDSRPDQDGKSIRRRRECFQCGKRWKTTERVEDDMPLVLKRNGTHAPFDRAKIISSLKIACGKRPISYNKIEEIIADIEWSILAKNNDVVTSTEIGNMIMESLRGLDEIAYIRYASVYRRFQDAGQLMREVKTLLPEIDTLDSSH